VTALSAAVAFNLAFIPPYWTLKVDLLDDLIALVVFVAVALAVGTLVALEGERRAQAEARSAEIAELYEQQSALRADQQRLASEKVAAELVGDQRSALLRSVSHDLRTPLATIRAVTSDLRDGADYDDATRADLLDLVGDEAERLDRLVANLLSLSRIQAGALEPERQAVAVDELLTDRVRKLKRLLRDRRIALDVPFALPLADADYTLVDQVVTNLLENAVRHSPEGSTIRVRARAKDEWIEVSVADQGPGISAEDQDRIFEPFRRGEGSTSSGVGLAICRAIVEAHGGAISARQANGGGAELLFTLPVHR
jgi:two-component system sensor histidine kinase KdpD